MSDNMTPRSQSSSGMRGKEQPATNTRLNREAGPVQTNGIEEPGGLLASLSGGDFSQGTFDRHMALLGDSRMSHPMYAQRRAEIVRRLQRDYGNSYVQRLVDHIQRSRIQGVQAKLTVGSAGDRYEREADRVAKQVVSATSPPVQAAQRQGPEEEEVQMKLLQRQVGVEGGAVDGGFERSVERARAGGKTIPDKVRSSMESAFGADFSNVRVHTGPEADGLNRSVSARAFTTGQDIFVRKEDHNLGSSSGRELLAHELTHVVQQTGATVRREPDIHRSDIDVLQRMVAVAKAQMTEDFVELTSVNFALTRVGGPVELLKDADFSNMTANDEVYIVGHGKPGASGDYPANQIVDFLLKGSKALKNPVKGIYFTSCSAGAGVTDDDTDSVVAAIRNALEAKGWAGVTVTGARGPSIKSNALGDDFTVVDPASLGVVGQLQTILKRIHEPQQKTSAAITKFESEKGAPATLEEKAAIATRETDKFYKEFADSIRDPGMVRDILNAAIARGQLVATADDRLLITLLDTAAKSGTRLTLTQPMLELVTK